MRLSDWHKEIYYTIFYTSTETKGSRRALMFPIGSSSITPIPTRVLDANKMAELEVSRYRQVVDSISLKILIPLFL